MAVNLDEDDLLQLVNLVRSGQVRDSSGFGNNISNPTWGAESSHFIRLTDPHYTDAVQGVRTTALTPRQISDLVSNQDDNGDGVDEDQPNPFGGSALLAYFGQYFDHGLDFIDKGLSGRVQIGSDTFPLNAPRSNIAGGTGLDPDGIPNSGDEVAAEYVNETAAFADLSQAYGSHNAVTDLLREWVDTPSGPVQTAYLLSGEIDESGFGMLPTRRPAAVRTETVIATTEPLPLVPPTSAPRSPRSGFPTSAIRRSTRSRPRLIPKRPRSVRAATAWR